MKLSVSLSEEDLAALDRYVADAGLESRSAGIQQAIRRLADPDLEAAYAAAWEEQAAAGEEDLWSATSSDGLTMLRGEIVLVDFDPVRGSEANKRRPAVIVSNDRANTTARRLGRGVVTVVPMTSNVIRVFPFQVLLPAKETGLPVDSKAQGEQVRSVAVERVGPAVGRVPTTLMVAIDDALRLHLHL